MTPFRSELLEPLRAAVAAWGGQTQSLDPWSDQIVRVFPPEAISKDIHLQKPSVLVGSGSTANYPLNSAVAASIARDKSHTASVLAQAGYQTPRGGHVFLSRRRITERPAGKEREAAMRLAESLGYPVYCKPLTGSKGDGVSLCHTKTELTAALDRLAIHHEAVRLEQPVVGDEYRLFVCAGTVAFIYRKSPISVTGDGKHSLFELACSQATLAETAIGSLLQQAGHNPETILPKGKVLMPFAAQNLSYGSEIADLKTKISPTLSDWALAAANALDLEVCGFDILANGDPDKLPTSDLTILEANANPSLLGIWKLGRTDLAIEIWQTILESYFTPIKGAK